MKATPGWMLLCSAATVAGCAANRPPSEAPCNHIPYIAGSFSRPFVPNGTRYVNDHTLVRGKDGLWHLYAITHSSAGDPESEHEFLHATAPALSGPWTERSDVLVADPAFDEHVLWAPFVIERQEGRFSMFYYADLIDDEPMRLVESVALSLATDRGLARPRRRDRDRQRPFFHHLRRLAEGHRRDASRVVAGAASMGRAPTRTCRTALSASRTTMRRSASISRGERYVLQARRTGI